MYKLKEFISKHKFFSILVFVFIALSILRWYLYRNIPTTPTTKPGGTDEIASYQGLTPGVSSKEDVKKELGTALNAKIEDNKETYEYASSNPNFNTEVVFFDDTLSYIKLVYTNKDEVKADSFRDKYGQPEEVLYGPEYSVGYILEAYPQNGFAFLSHKVSRNVREAWYFKPMSLEEFLNTFAIGYSETEKVIR